ncbi:MAG: hypothetical protein EXX96DRAFT_311493 [Benjaminiella poitrasii]|nr:MAG: hypothetical protein EXX96DRAFT_311493 [Benjaminiella poitrasii]
MKRSFSLSDDKKTNGDGSTSPDIRNIKRKLNDTDTANKPIPPKRNTRKANETTTATTTTTTAAAATGIIKNHDVCDACGDVGQFICCDACPNSFHFTCIEPPMDSSDIANLKDNWYCNECEYKYNKAKLPRSNPRGLFQKLLDDLNTKNPKAFRLPKDIVQFFDGVSTDKQGRYIDASQNKRVRYNRNGEMETPDYHQLKNKSGKFIVCYHCRKTALKNPIIACDYCTLHWHLDCLNPPLASPPNPGKKWRCPNHIEHIVKPPRTLKKKAAVSIINDKTPFCAYQNYLDTLFDDDIIETKKPLSVHKKQTTPTDSIITTKNGCVYRLPAHSIQFADFSDYVKKAIAESKTSNRRNSIPSTLPSSSSSEVSTPPTFTTTTSPILSSDKKPILPHQTEINTWLHNMAFFQAGGDENITMIENHTPTKVYDNNLLTLIHAATSSSPLSLEENNKKRIHIDMERYKKYQKFQQLLSQKNEQELLKIFSDEY